MRRCVYMLCANSKHVQTFTCMYKKGRMQADCTERNMQQQQQQRAACTPCTHTWPYVLAYVCTRAPGTGFGCPVALVTHASTLPLLPLPSPPAATNAACRLLRRTMSGLASARRGVGQLTLRQQAPTKLAPGTPGMVSSWNRGAVGPPEDEGVEGPPGSLREMLDCVPVWLPVASNGPTAGEP